MIFVNLFVNGKGVLLAHLFLLGMIYSKLSYSDSISIASEYRSVSYAEYSDDSYKLNTEEGSVIGLNLKASFQVSSRYVLGASYYQLDGDLSYDGFSQGGARHKTRSRANFFGGQVSCNRDYGKYQIGVGWTKDHWNRFIKPANGFLALNERYRKRGVVFRGYAGEGSLYAESFIVRYLSSEMKVDLTEIGQGWVEIPLPDYWAGKVSLGYESEISKGTKINLLSSYSFAQMPKSGSVPVGNKRILEPKNSTEYISISIGIRFYYL